MMEELPKIIFKMTNIILYSGYIVYSTAESSMYNDSKLGREKGMEDGSRPF